MFCIVNKKDNISDSIRNNIEPYILHENNNYYYLPRQTKKYLKYDCIKLYRNDNFIYDKILPFDFYSQLYDRQSKIFEKVQEFYQKNNSIYGIIQARPGFGKTVLATYLIYKLQFRTLIILDSDMLISQQIEEILTHTSLTLNDIGQIKGNRFDVENKRVIISTPQTLSSKFTRDDNIRKEYYKKIQKLGINLVFQDECHIISNVQATALLFFDTLNVIGLTATPYHVGNKNKFSNMIFNNIIAKYIDYSVKPTVYFVKYKSSSKDNKTIKRLYGLYYNQYIMFKGLYNKLIYDDNIQVNQIFNIVDREKGKYTIIIVDTIKQMNLISDFLHKKGISNIKLYAKQKDIDKEKDKVIVAIYKYASKAFDNKYLECIILPTIISGRKSLSQTIGRVLRENNNKSNARAYIFYDIYQPTQKIFNEINKIQKNIIKREYKNVDIQYLEIDN